MDRVLAEQIAYLARYGHVQPSVAMNLEPDERAAIIEALSDIIQAENEDDSTPDRLPSVGTTRVRLADLD